VTVMRRPSTFTVTPAGSGIGRFPSLDMFLPPLLADSAQQFATHPVAAALAIALDALAGRNDRTAHTAKDSRQPVSSGVDPATGLAYAVDELDHALAVGAVLQLDPKHLLGGNLLVRLFGEGSDKALAHQRFGNRHLESA